MYNYCQLRDRQPMRQLFTAKTGTRAIVLHDDQKGLLRAVIGLKDPKPAMAVHEYLGDPSTPTKNLLLVKDQLHKVYEIPLQKIETKPATLELGNFPTRLPS